jgi:hypothetical protein
VMKKLTLILSLVFTVNLSFPSYAEWVKVAENVDGSTYYVDFERIRKVDGYVYYWVLSDFLKPNDWGNLSSKIQKQGDCKLFRFKKLSASFHTQPMGGGTGESYSPKNPEWKYPPPNTGGDVILKKVCTHSSSVTQSL